MLKKVGIVKRVNSIAYKVFSESIADDFTKIDKMNPSEYVKYCWNRYKAYCKNFPQDNSTNGNVFELIVESELYRQSLCPMFLQAKVAFVPNVKFDVLLYSSEMFPVGLSLKTSLRERYKQADLEAVALKYVHRKAQNYLIMLKSEETGRLKTKCKNGELLGINEVIAADCGEFDDLITLLSEMAFINPKKIDIIKGKMVTK
jgi:hypothetical protein